jgi:flagellar hook assembly protein FlgD
VDDGAGVFSPNGDDRQDTLTLTVELSEASTWTLRVLDGDGDTLAREEGSGDVAAMTWAPETGSVGDGTYRWELEAVDRWGNGPLEADGTVRVDVTAPALSLAGAGSETVVSFAPNGDGYRDTFSFSGTSTEAGSLLATVLDEDDEGVDSLSGRLAGGAATLVWDGRTDAGYVPDGRYTIRVRARDLAGNVSDAQTRTVDVYAALGFVQASRTFFFPQDGDALARSTTFSMTLRSPATVTWRVLDAAGVVVRTFATDAPYEAGRWTKSWNGRDDAGAFVPRGSYRAEVRATDGTNEATQRVGVRADAFRITVSDTTPADGQRLTVTVVSAEALARNPRVAFSQPGLSTWSAATTRIATSTYRVTVTLKASRSGTLKLRAYGTDTNGGTQRSYLSLPLH